MQIKSKAKDPGKRTNSVTEERLLDCFGKVNLSGYHFQSYLVIQVFNFSYVYILFRCLDELVSNFGINRQLMNSLH